MPSSFFRPPRRRAAGTITSRQWQEPFVFPDGRRFAVQSATLRLYDEDDQWNPDQRLLYSCVSMSVIEEAGQCYFEFEVNFWPDDFASDLSSDLSSDLAKGASANAPCGSTPGVTFEDAEWQFAYARRRIHTYLSTAHPQRGLSEYPWAIQMDYEGKS